MSDQIPGSPSSEASLPESFNFENDRGDVEQSPGPDTAETTAHDRDAQNRLQPDISPFLETPVPSTSRDSNQRAVDGGTGQDQLAVLPPPNGDFMAYAISLVYQAEGMTGGAERIYLKARHNFFIAEGIETDPKVRELLRWYKSQCDERIEALSIQNATVSNRSGFLHPGSLALNVGGFPLFQNDHSMRETSRGFERTGTPHPESQLAVQMQSNFGRKRSNADDVETTASSTSSTGSKDRRVDSVVHANLPSQGFTTYIPVDASRVYPRRIPAGLFYSRFATDTASRSFDQTMANRTWEAADTFAWMKAGL